MNRTNGSYERFKLFGLQRTATNLVWRGVTENFEVESAEIGGEWKHGPIGRSAEAGCAIIVCTRHPLAWLDAMYRFSMEIDDRDGCPHFRRSPIRWRIYGRRFSDIRQMGPSASRPHFR